MNLMIYIVNHILLWTKRSAMKLFYLNTKTKFFTPTRPPPRPSLLSQILELIQNIYYLKPLITNFKKNILLHCRYWNNGLDIFGFFHFLAYFFEFFWNFFNLGILMNTKLWKNLLMTFSGNSNKKKLNFLD
jgi:hypothetical protein